MLEAQTFKYAAFLSYSHLDKACAARIQESLETFEFPADLVGQATPIGRVPARIAPLFRDCDELQAGDLGDGLKAALRQSRFLIVVCSPAAARSKWIEQEIAYFESVRGAEFLLCALVDSTEAGDVPNVTTFFPKGLWRAINGTEEAPLSAGNFLAADIRQVTGRPWDGKLSLLSRLVGLSFDQLKRRDAIRRSRRIANIAAEQVASGRPDIGVLLARDAVLQVPEPHHANNAWRALFQALQEFRLDSAMSCPDKPSAIAFSTDGCRLAVGDTRGGCRIWNHRTRRIEHTLAGHSDSIRQCAFGFGGTRLISIACDGSAQLWDVATGTAVWRVDGEAGIAVGTFLTKAGLIATGGRTGTISLWDARGKKAHVLQLGTADITCVAAFADNRLLISSASDGGVHAWDLSTDKPIVAFLGKRSPVVSLAVFETGEERLLACGYGGPEGAACVWRIPTAFPRAGFFSSWFHSSRIPEIDPIMNCQFPAPVASVALVGQRPRLAIATSSGIVEIRLISENTVERSFEPEQRAPSRDPDRIQRLYAAIGEAVLDPTDIDAGNIPIAAIEPEMRHIAISSRQSGAIRLWNLEDSVITGGRISQCDLHGHTGPVELLHFSPCGRYLASCADDIVRLWFAPPGRDLWSETTRPESRPVVPTGKLEPERSKMLDGRLRPLSDGRVEVLDSGTGRILSTLQGHTDLVIQCEFNPAGQFIATVSKDNTARVWDARSGKQICQLQVRPWENPLGGIDLKNMDVDEFKFRLLTTTVTRLDSIRFTNDGTKIILIQKQDLLLADDGDNPLSKELSLFNFSGEEVHQNASGKILCTSPDGGALVTESREGLWAWNMNNGTTLLLDSAATGCAEGAVERRVSFASSNRIVVQWYYYRENKPEDEGGAIGVFSGETGLPLNYLKWAGRSDSAFIVLPKNFRIAFVNRSTSVRIWDLEDGTERHVLSIPEASFVKLKVNVQGDRVAALDRPQTVHLFDCNTGRYIARLSGHYNACGSYLEYEFSPNGRHLATGGIDTDIRLWETETGQELGLLKHADQVTPAFIDDHRLLASSANVARTPDRVWNTLPGSPALLAYVDALIAAEVLPERLESTLLGALSVED